MHSSSALSRRTFVGAAAGAATLSAAAYARVVGANDRIGVGFVGFGLIGKRHVLDFQAQSDVHMAAVCDAHRGRIDEAKATIGGDVRGYGDFRRLLDDPEIHAVVVSTPDHWHALVTMLACAAGKDVYVEKPLSLFVREGRWMADVARRAGRVVQVGTQQRSGLHYRRARELIRAGHIGRVMSVRMHAYRNIMPGFGSPADSSPPAELDWDMLQGPAPAHAYNPNRGIYHFRWFWDYSGGQMTNLGHHSLDIMHWILGGHPLAVTSVGGRFCLTDNGETPDTQDALFEFPQGSDGHSLDAATSSDGRRTDVGWTATWSHREASGGPSQPFSMEFYGTKGMLGINRGGFTVFADKQVPPANRVPQFTGAHPIGGPQAVALDEPAEPWTTSIVDRSGDEREQFTLHARNFLDCVKSRATPVSDLESSHRVSTMCHLANLSLRLGRRIEWDAAREQVVGDNQANAALVRMYRKPWDAELRALEVS